MLAEKYALSLKQAAEIFEQYNELKSFYFETADVKWLHCIVAHRKDGAFKEIKTSMKDYDVVSGKIANDDTNATILAYMGNLYGPMGSEQADKMCISLLLPERLQDQFCFRSEKAISTLEFLKSEKVSLEFILMKSFCRTETEIIISG